MPNLWIDWIDVQGPAKHEPTPLSAEKLFAGRDIKKASDEDARPILEKFACEAFRRVEPDAAYIENLMHVYKVARGHGVEILPALKDAMTVVLASPRFLFLYEPQADAAKRPLADRELAVRLSYFLWSGPPDAELYTLAESGKLRDPQELAALGR